LHILIMGGSTARRRLTPRDKRSFFRYLAVGPDARAWGVFVPDAGYTLIPPGSPYPPYLHPADHHFTWERGRVLRSFQFVYITRGGGTFESERGGRQRVRAGDLFILFPDVWHRYRPDPRTGWDEYWLEMDGDHARRLMALDPFDPARPVLRIGRDEKLVQLFLEAVDTLRREPPEYRFLLGAQAVMIIAHTLSALKRRRFEGRPAEEIIREAKALLARAAGRSHPLDGVAAQLSLSYSTFRRLFRQYTGLSPRQYALRMSLRRAGDLLARTRLPVGRIAEELGFESVYYFSRFFRKKMGCAPTEYRARCGGKRTQT
jgi:AraC-like DNA-binding protein